MAGKSEDHETCPIRLPPDFLLHGESDHHFPLPASFEIVVNALWVSERPTKRLFFWWLLCLFFLRVIYEHANVVFYSYAYY